LDGFELAACFCALSFLCLALAELTLLGELKQERNHPFDNLSFPRVGVQRKDAKAQRRGGVCDEAMARERGGLAISPCEKDQ